MTTGTYGTEPHNRELVAVGGAPWMLPAASGGVPTLKMHSERSIHCLLIGSFAIDSARKVLVLPRLTSGPNLLQYNAVC